MGIKVRSGGQWVEVGGVDLAQQYDQFLRSDIADTKVGVTTFTDDLIIADKITHLNDTDTAIRFPSNDTFTVETAGSERVRVNNVGDVTLNLSTGFQDEGVLKFGRADEVDRSHYIRLYNSGTPSANYMKFQVHAGTTGSFVTPLTLFGDSKVGINTDSATQDLDVNGNARFRGAIYDGGNGAGTSGQILSSTGTGIDWVNPSGLSAGNADTLDNLESTQFLRSDENDSYVGIITGNTLILGGSEITASSAALQVKGFQRTGTIYLHEGATAGSTNATLSNSSNVLSWNSNKIWHEGNDGSGSGLDADTLDGYQADTSGTNSTVAVRSGNGDLNCRLVRQTFANQSTISGGIVFRVNNSSDNYLRICNDTAAIRDYLEINSNSSTLSTAQSASGAGTVTFNDVPSGIKRITVMFRDLSLNGGNDIRIQLGTSSGWVTSGYNSQSSGESGSAESNATNGFVVRNTSASDSLIGQMIITKFNSTAWVATGQFSNNSSSGNQCYGDVGSTGGTITRVRIQTAGSNTFDAGNINVLYG